MSNISNEVANLSPLQRAFLELQLRKRSTRSTQAEIVRQARDHRHAFPLSFAQQRLWFLDQLEPGKSFYNIPLALRLQGTLDTAALEQSLNEVMRRHEILRTSFRIIDGQPMQVIESTPAIELPVIDLRGLSELEHEREVARLANEASQQLFDLARGPLMSSMLLRLGEEEYILLFTMHHIISDGWSIGVLVKEVATLYSAYTTGRPSPLPELPIQYADFAHWQREWLQGDVLDAQLSYWKRQLAGAPPLLELPTDRPRPPIQTYNGAHLSLSLPLPLCAALRTLCRDEGVTLFMAMLAAFQTLLYRYTGEEDIVVSTGIANRMRAEVEPLIGFFVNTLVLRTDLGGSPTFRELLKQVREVTLGAYAHQDVPFELIVEAMQPERNPSYTPIFQVMFMLQNAPLKTVEVPELNLNLMGGESTTAKFDLTLFIEEGREQLAATMEYNTDLFDETTIRRLLGYYQALLESIVADPAEEVDSLSLITEEESQQLIETWS